MLQRGREWLGCLTCLLAPMLAGASTPSTSQKLSADSLLYVRVYADRSALLSGMSHDHVMRATGFDASLLFDANQPERCRAYLTIPVEKLAVDEPAMRKRIGLEGSLDDADRREVREHMLASDQLSAEQFPSVKIALSRCTPAKEHGYLADVAVTIRGRTLRLGQRVPIRWHTGELLSRGTLRLLHTQFGIEPYSALLGSVRNADAFDLVWDVRARPSGT